MSVKTFINYSNTPIKMFLNVIYTQQSAIVSTKENPSKILDYVRSMSNIPSEESNQIILPPINIILPSPRSLI